MELSAQSRSMHLRDCASSHPRLPMPIGTDGLNWKLERQGLPFVCITDATQLRLTFRIYRFRRILCECHLLVLSPRWPGRDPRLCLVQLHSQYSNSWGSISSCKAYCCFCFDTHEERGCRLSKLYVNSLHKHCLSRQTGGLPLLIEFLGVFCPVH